MTNSTQMTKRRQLFLTLSVFTVLACAAYFLAVPAYQANAKKKKKSTAMLATATFPTSTALPAEIPDSSPATGVSLDIPVAGLTDEVRGVALNITFDNSDPGLTQHTWMGDINIVLTAPDLANHLILCDDISESSDLRGPYTFTDASTDNPWLVGDATGGADPIAAGAYRTTDCGEAVTDMNPVFQGPAFADIDNMFDKKSSGDSKIDRIPTDNLGNGTWTLNVADDAGGDTGNVSAASLTITTLAPTAASASIGGAVLTDSGQAVSRALVTVLNTETSESITVRTNQFGYFRIEDLPVGQFYTMSVSHKQYIFEPQSFTLEDDTKTEFRSGN